MEIAGDGSVVGIHGQRGKSKVYPDYDTGHLYRVSWKTPATWYMKCVDRRCTGRGKIALKDEKSSNFSVQELRPHNHYPQQEYALVAELKRRIKDRCLYESTAFFEIFNEECSRSDPEIAAKLNYRSMYTTMRKARVIAAKLTAANELSEIGFTGIKSSVSGIDGQCSNSKIYVDENSGHLYRCNKKRGSNWYVKCLEHGCPGRGKMVVEGENSDNLTVQELRAHNHPPRKDFPLIADLRKRIRDRCIRESTEMRTIFDEECSKSDQEIAAKLSYQSMYHNLRKARLKAAIPEEVIEHINKLDPFTTNISEV